VARFYTNENIALPVVEELRRLGHVVLTSLDAGKANASVPDSQVLDFAAKDSRILLTHNRRHFMRLHAHRQLDHSGIVVCTVDSDFSALAFRIHSELALAGDTTNLLIRINRPDQP